MSVSRYPPLRYTVPGIILVLGAVALCIYFLLEQRLLEDRLHESAENDLRVLATVSAGGLEAAFRLDERPKARAAIERLAGNRQIETALLADTEGRIQFATDAQLTDRRVSDVRDAMLKSVFEQAVRGERVVIQHWHDPDGVAGAFPISMRTDPDTFLPGETGWLVIDTDLSQLAARLRRDLMQRLIPFAGVLILFSLLLWAFFRHVLLKRIHRLTVASRKLAKGDFSTRPDIGHGDELAELSEEFGRMAEHLQRHSEELEFLSSHDSLTGLLNRRGLEHHLDNVIAHIHHAGGRHLLFYLDIDGFRVINDTQGHAAGDSLLREVSKRLRDGLPPRTPIARMAGDEFALLLPEPGDRDARGAAESLQKLITDFRFEWGEEKYRMAFNIGAVRLAREIETTERALSLADAACYAAKATPHTRIRVWDPAEEPLTEQHGEMHWVGRIQSALDQNRFELYAQPIFPATGPNGIRIELLVRMRERDGTLILPNRILPAAEHYGLISQIDRWVIRNAFEFFREHPTLRNRVDFCAFNLSALSLGNREVIDLVTEEVGRGNGFRPGQLCFEVTETAAVTNLTVAAGFMGEMRRLGCRFALDDFGSGVSSFGYLKNLEVELIKIDGLFVRGALSDSTDRAIVRSINDIAHEMGKQTVAEFVESREIAREMRRIGVDYLQGNGLAKTGPLRQVLAQAARRGGRSRS